MGPWEAVVKEVGGYVLLQTPESAQFDEMPKSVIETGIADSIAPPENMPHEILRYVEHPYASVLRNGPRLRTKKMYCTDFLLSFAKKMG